MGLLGIEVADALPNPDRESLLGVAAAQHDIDGVPGPGPDLAIGAHGALVFLGWHKTNSVLLRKRRNCAAHNEEVAPRGPAAIQDIAMPPRVPRMAAS